MLANFIINLTLSFTSTTFESSSAWGPRPTSLPRIQGQRHKFMSSGSKILGGLGSRWTAMTLANSLDLHNHKCQRSTLEGPDMGGPDLGPPARRRPCFRYIPLRQFIFLDSPLYIKVQRSQKLYSHRVTVTKAIRNKPNSFISSLAHVCWFVAAALGLAYTGKHRKRTNSFPILSRKMTVSVLCGLCLNDWLGTHRVQFACTV